MLTPECNWERAAQRVVWDPSHVKVYVAGSLGDAREVREVQGAVVAAGHELVLDWTRGPDAELRDYDSHPEEAGQVAHDDLGAVLDADAVLLVASDLPGRGMFVEFGAALARAQRHELEHVIVLGSGSDVGSVFFFHPAVRRYASVQTWLDSLD